jgi:hypothetical protein
MGMARWWRVGRRGRPLHLRLYDVNQPLAARSRFAAEGRRGVQITRQVGTASRRPHVSESAWIHCLARAVHSRVRQAWGVPRRRFAHTEAQSPPRPKRNRRLAILARADRAEFCAVAPVGSCTDELVRRVECEAHGSLAHQNRERQSR